MDRVLIETLNCILSIPIKDIDYVLTKGAEEMTAYAPRGYRFKIRLVASIIINGHRYDSMAGIPEEIFEDHHNNFLDSVHCSTINYTNRYSDESGVIKII